MDFQEMNDDLSEWFNDINECNKLRDLQWLVSKESRSRELNYLDMFVIIDKAFDLGNQGRLLGFLSRR